MGSKENHPFVIVRQMKQKLTGFALTISFFHCQSSDWLSYCEMAMTKSKIPMQNVSLYFCLFISNLGFVTPPITCSGL